MATDSRRNVALTLGTNLSLSVLNAGTGVLIARMLGPTARGELAAVQLWAFFLGTLAALGVPDAVVYFSARRRDEAGTYLASAALLTFLTSVAFLVVGWFVVPVFLGQQTDAVKDLARVFLLILPVYVLAGAPANALRGRSEFLRWNALRVLAPGLWLVVVLAARFTGHADVTTLTLGFMAGQVIMLGVSLVVALPRIHPPYRPQRQLWRPMLRYGLPGVLSTVPQMLNLRLDQMLLAAFVSSQRLGLYVAAVAWAGVIAPVLGALGSVLFPRLAGEHDEAAQASVLLRGVRVAVVVAVVVVALVLVVTPFAVRLLFGADYADAVPAALVLVVAGGVLAVDGVLEEGFRGLGRPAEVLYAELAGLVTTGILLAALLGPLDIVGAALASVGGYTTTFVVLVVRLRRHLDRPIGGELVPTPADVRDVVTSVRSLVRRTPAS